MTASGIPNWSWQGGVFYRRDLIPLVLVVRWDKVHRWSVERNGKVLARGRAYFLTDAIVAVEQKARRLP